MSTYSETARELRSPGRLIRAQRSDLAPVRALRLAAGVVLPLTVGVTLGHPQYGAYAALGALPAGFAAMVGEHRRRPAAVALATAGMAVGAFVGAVAAGHTWPLITVVAACAYLAGVLSAFNDHVGTAVIQWPAALLIATANPQNPRQAAVHAGFLLAGGLGQAALTTLGVPARPATPPRLRRPRALARHFTQATRAHLALNTVHGQHALRLAATAATAQGTATLLGLSHGYWASLTAVLVLKTDHVLTVRRCLDRIGGTAIGMLLGILLAMIATHGHTLLLLGAAATITLAYTVFTANYFVFSLFLTGFVVLLLDLLGEGASQTAGPRLLATCLGGVTALIASHVRPRHTGR
jgi:uncharacterized membrane protein YccC